MKGMTMNRKQLTVFLVMLLINALCAFVSYTFFLDKVTASAGVPMPKLPASNFVLGLANAGIVIVLYGILGWAGIWFAHKLGLPGVFSEDGNWQRWFIIPMLLGLLCGVILILGDQVFAPINGFGHFPHPTFPVSILASLSAGIGEEMLFRGFVFGLWGLLLNWLLKRFNARTVALWIANVIAAIAFGAGHLGTIFFLTHASSFADLNPVLLVETFLLNGILGLIAGQRYMKDGLVAAAGVHFWNDVVFHVIYGLL
jgi:membrane protease YdiL (CAAX protease family)